MPAEFQLINLESNVAFTFQHFPNETSRSAQANWEPQETTIGRKPLHYANSEPRSYSFADLYLDETATGISLKDRHDNLLALMDEVEDRGRPPALLAIWGDNRERCVLAKADIEELFFNDAGECTRSRITLELTELQPDGEATTIRIPDDIDPGGG